MAQFHSLLKYDNAALAEKAPDKEGPLDAAKAAVCANINLFLEINDDEFGPFVETFVQSVWMQLVNVSLAPGQVTISCLAITQLLCSNRHMRSSFWRLCRRTFGLCAAKQIHCIDLRSEQH